MKLPFLLLCLFNMALSDPNQNQSVKVPIDLEIDPNGYVIFCLCMGRFGNQADQFLGAMSFARSLNRTLVVPPFHTYKNIPYEEWFRLDALSSFHRVIAAEEFMHSVAPRIWPKERRVGFCWRPPESMQEENRPLKNCRMKEGYPMKSFWSELGVDEFPQSVIFHIDWSESEKWRTLYGPREYPVLAFRGAPGAFPVLRENWTNQRYMQLSEKIEQEVNEIIKKSFGDEKFVGIHLRNGEDWSIACRNMGGMRNYMASPQCLGDYDGTKELTKEMCLPSKRTILEQLESLLVAKGIRNVYIATDKDPMLDDIRSRLEARIPSLNLVHHDPWLPLIDLAVLGRSEHFIGNCVSSFTSFVKRFRDVHNKTTYFWAFS